jgi:hypothetical protein
LELNTMSSLQIDRVVSNTYIIYKIIFQQKRFKMLIKSSTIVLLQ